MYDDILGPRDEDVEKVKTPKNRVNLKDKICYDCGQPFEECECEEGFGLGDLEMDDDGLEMKEDPWDGADEEDDGGCVGVGCLGTTEPEDEPPEDEPDCCCDDCDCSIPPEQDIGCLKTQLKQGSLCNDEGRNCDGQCKTCEMYDCMYQYLD